MGSKRTELQSTVANSQGSDPEYEFKQICEINLAFQYRVFRRVHSNNFSC
jgi:hypothetical protein